LEFLAKMLVYFEQFLAETVIVGKLQFVEGLDFVLKQFLLSLHSIQLFLQLYILYPVLSDQLLFF
jgi:hypothetical protein